jgi:hypothetical protein
MKCESGAEPFDVSCGIHNLSRQASNAPQARIINYSGDRAVARTSPAG